ncbi:type-F conjugative transfer system secretin TraK [Piscinibacter sakaiensis]|uniref:type-F conjugative transfer system secretin TraK n=1 Tax=Piscinibacter sakaiensis TaxID=1547922 RepID=UPI003AAA8E7B
MLDDKWRQDEMRLVQTVGRQHRPAWSCVAACTMLACAVLFGIAPAAQALQTIEARDGVAVEAILSIKEPTRIRIEGSPITDVVGNVQAGNCAPSAAATPVGAASPAAASNAEVLLECDRDKGEIYLRPLGDSTKPVNLFIASAHATYTLVLRRSDTPADTIVIRDKTPRPTSVTGGGTAAGTSASHIRGLKAMLLVMAQDRLAADVRVDEVNQPLLLWTETRFTLLRRYQGRGLIGEKYLLQNVSGAEMVVAEPEFDRPDSATGGEVIGIAVESQTLRPLETTQVFVIRRGGER